MHLFSRCLVPFIVASCALPIACGEPAPERSATPVPSASPASAPPPEAPPPSAATPTPDGQAFSDATYGYSLRLPGDWEPVTNLAAGKVIRLSVVTPAHNRFIATIDALDQPVTRASKFETVGETYVDPIVMRLLRVFKLPDGARQTDDHSKPDSMRFWQGTSTIGETTGPAMLLSLHAIRFDSDVMVNLVYMSTHSSTVRLTSVEPGLAPG
jgi:hypothetical protein